MKKVDLAIIGSGPAGLMAAIIAARNGKSVAIFERLSQASLKLLATGGGNCNITNTLDEESFMSAFGRQGRFMVDALYSFNNDALRDFLAELEFKPKSQNRFMFGQKAAREFCRKNYSESVPNLAFRSA